MNSTMLNGSQPFYFDTKPPRDQPSSGENMVAGETTAQSPLQATVAASSTTTTGTPAQTAPAAPTQAHGVAALGVRFGGELAAYVYPLGRERLPHALVHAKIWLVWKSVPKPDASKKPAKVPYYVSGAPRHGALDTPDDRRQLASFEEAIDAYWQGPYDGLAVALGPDGSGSYWQGFDADNVPAVNLDAMMATLPGYVEVSPSGHGCHAIGYGRHFKSLGSNGSNVEAYAGGRFFTFTGDSARGELVCIGDFVEGQVAQKHDSVPQTASAGVGSVYVDASTVTELRSALNQMRSDERDLWIRMGHALKELGDVGRGLWLDWSRSSDLHRPREDAKTWDSFKPTSTGYQAVFAEATRKGWINPKSNAAQGQAVQPVDPEGFSFKFAMAGEAIAQIDYLLDPWLPSGAVIGCYGRGEAGKTSFTAQMCAAASSQVSTFWISSEERQDHIRQRHLACNGQVSTLGMIDVLPTKFDSKTGKPISTSFNIYEHLEPALVAFRHDPQIREDRPLGIVVLDAVVALVTWSKGGGANDDAEVKRLIAFLFSLAERYGVTIIMLGHLNKGAGHEHAADAVTGSAAWTNSVRLAYMLAKDTESESFGGFIRTVKSNTGTQFGSHYATVPVHTLRERPDGKNEVLCGVELNGPVVWGELALREMMADEDDRWLNKMDKKRERVQTIVDAVLHALRGGATTRKAVEVRIDGRVSRRHWQEADKLLTGHGVQVQNDKHNERVYFRAQ